LVLSSKLLKTTSWRILEKVAADNIDTNVKVHKSGVHGVRKNMYAKFHVNQLKIGR